ncbi:Flp pilus assembly protein CpaB [Blastococcus sp. CT_GayMR16]|uniref:Flp pilus assembly protein CpaB n=1 Tax=Blastococcus sp. CT_GayMR16 TaxID=2559607 RepID=UPI001073E65D|nr:Flp pilus assembly protein CpaB [Blastococcus sp. CT_GayMR16]TFV90683.1 Flp pilus assembly protein CpaB [Blastococcus sp. CT_GayMR16]
MPHFRRPRSPVHVARQVAAVLLGVLALVLALRPAPVDATARVPDGVEVAVSVRDLPAGTVLGAGDLEAARYPPEAVPAGVAADPEQLLHRVLAGGVRAGEPITDARLVGAGLTALLPEGQVAAPVRLADLAIAGLVRTGDRVDVLATAADAAAAEVVAGGALVLAAIGADEESGAGLLLIAVDGDTAARLAAAATTATLTVNLPPP